MPSHAATASPPPSGPFTTTALLIDTATGERGTISGTTNTGTSEILNGDYRVSVIARDPHTGTTRRLDNVKVKMSTSFVVSGFRENQKFTLHCRSYRDFKQGAVATMELVPAADSPVIQNQSLPAPVKIKNTLDSFSANPSAVCRSFNEQQEQARRRMGLVNDRDDINVFQGNANGRSPGVLVHQQDGRMYMFDASGKQYIMMGGTSPQIVGTGLDIGQGSIERNTLNYGGLPARENPVNDIVPQGTILTPQPKYILYYTKAMNTILPIMDMIDLVKTCAQAIKLIMSGDDGGEAVANAQDSSLEQQYYGEQYQRGTSGPMQTGVARNE